MKIISAFRNIFIAGLMTASLFSCNRDHKKETISNYIQYVWKRQPSEIMVLQMDDSTAITGKDSVEFLIAEYAKGINPKPTLDTILKRIESDIVYNSNLLIKANQQIDSLVSFQKKDPNNEVVKTLVKGSTDLKALTDQQIEELKYYRGAFKKYSENKEKVYCYPVKCQYKVKAHAPDTASKVVVQKFYLSPDTRKIYRVK